MFQDNRSKLIILTLTHLVVDFYGGLCIPLPEPTLIRHLSTSLFMVMVIISGSAIIVNAIQPLSVLFLPNKGAPVILWLAPLMAAFTALIGLTNNYFVIALILFQAAFWIGVLHPEAVIAVQSLSNRQQGLATSIFMSGGFFGFSFGSLVGGWWGQHFALRYFWLLIIPGIISAILILMSGLNHHYGSQTKQSTTEDENDIPFPPVFILAICIATFFVIIARFIPIYLVRNFGEHAQVYGGSSLFMIGLFGAFGSWLWGYLTERFGCGKVIATVCCIGAPMLYMLLYETTLSMFTIWSIGVGLTIGGIFPLCVVLVRKSSLEKKRLRLGLCIGGAWGTGELTAILAAKYIDGFHAKAVEPVADVLNCCWIMLAATAILGLIISFNESRQQSQYPPL